MNILIIDDSHLAFMNLKKHLESLLPDSLIIWVSDGIDAITIVKKFSFDIIFCDFNMPFIHGGETVKNLREYIKLTPVILVTSDVFSEEEIANMGFEGYIRKDEFMWSLLVSTLIDLKYLPKNNDCIFFNAMVSPKYISSNI